MTIIPLGGSSPQEARLNYLKTYRKQKEATNQIKSAQVHDLALLSSFFDLLFHVQALATVLEQHRLQDVISRFQREADMLKKQLAQLQSQEQLQESVL